MQEDPRALSTVTQGQLRDQLQRKTKVYYGFGNFLKFKLNFEIRRIQSPDFLVSSIFCVKWQDEKTNNFLNYMTKSAWNINNISTNEIINNSEKVIFSLTEKSLLKSWDNPLSECMIKVGTKLGQVSQVAIGWFKHWWCCSLTVWYMQIFIGLSLNSIVGRSYLWDVC